MPIILGWLAIAVILSVSVPSLEQVEKDHAVAMNPDAAPSFQATQRMGKLFDESNSGVVAMIVVEGQQPLGEDTHRYYDDLIRQLKADTTHVQHVQDFWGDDMTQAAAQSLDGKATYVQVALTDPRQGVSANQSVEAVRGIVDRTQAPQGVKAFVTGPAAFAADLGPAGNRTVLLVTGLSLAVIFTMLLLVYRSVVSVILMLVVVGIELTVARGFVALLGNLGFIGITTFVVNLLVALAIAAGTDYGIFFTGRYQEARRNGEDKEAAFYATFRSVAKVVLGSGLTIAGAVLCLHFTRLPVYQTLGVATAVGMVVAVAVAITLVPAVIAVGSRFGLFEPKRKVTVRRWRRIGTAIVRWPAPILVATCAVALIGLLTLPVYQPSYNDQKYIPQDIPANVGYAAASRHFPQSLMMAPDILLIEADHDMRNPVDFLVLNKLARGVQAVPGVSRVQAVTRPGGEPLKHTTIPFMLSMSSASQSHLMPFQRNRMDDLLVQADDMLKTIAIMKRMQALTEQMVGTTHDMVGTTHELEDIMNDLRDHVMDFDDFIRPLRNYLYWEKHCYDIPVCQALRSVFDTLDGVDEVSDKLSDLVANLDRLDELLPQMAEQFPVMIETMESTRKMMLSMHSTMSGIFDQMEQTTNNATAMGKAFDAAQNDDSFYLPPEVFENEDFKRVMDIFLSPDGKAARLLISQRGDPATREGMSLVQPIETAAAEALKGTPLRNAKIYMAGTAASVKDIVDGSKYDLLIAATAALCLIFGIMLIMTRSFVAALVIVGTVALSLGAAFGLSVLIWQSILGIPLNWVVLAMSVIILLAVGSDYNLLLVSRMKEELGAGINTGIIRAMGGTGKVVTSAGLVFALTMLSMVVSDLVTIGQLGCTIGIGLLFDTLVVRAFMTPSIAALLGRWFWWPQRVRQRPARAFDAAAGPRPLVSFLLQKQER
ncbi:putative membrane protein mmpL4 [Mycobacteroides abscessus subsp. bolletii 1S-154-0310]|uniref:Transport family protein n=1 Tax=Mycobacteroides abscessus MAB_091912_2446 TaxID=1335414 RepID=A0A829LYL0_9MYCO|nr:membrane protein MmpL [Mycobacteroides abscessus 47J26]EIU58115.1 putative membrane protein mmpL4 [Mycobacteroides abscessus subsp. bolletii 1S-151-0930]EIU71547.1 putative membrane protein mmpL4 [Mycobacteroides abscessus subsp. bolletii 1S-153-0915]EIU72873.1 putative membrane protein mmpL4 [Mycobacteroides abscessus subsp. bolletii 1S-152-0914]EIU76186.1 putative membrane protein mmpL4 [Mycobacteroides abscessus subsp. bolletii 1S-154-0310]EIU78940.1 putative membrane protein mmpL4 [Myco